MAENMDDLLSLGEAAKVIGVSRTTVWQWHTNGRIEAVGVGANRLAIRRSVAMLARARVLDAKERGDRRWGAVRAQG